MDYHRYEYKCPVCGKSFKDRVNQIYCSKECRYEAVKNPRVLMGEIKHDKGKTRDTIS